jgi:hypothetical protein
MSRPVLFDSRSMTDYRQNCIRENAIQNRILHQLEPSAKKIPYSTVSVGTSKFLQNNAAVIRDTDRNKVFNNRRLV